MNIPLLFAPLFPAFIIKFPSPSCSSTHRSKATTYSLEPAPQQSAYNLTSQGRGRRDRQGGRPGECTRMLDWAPVVVGVALFVLLSPGLLIEFPGTRRWVDFGSLRVTGKAATIHTIIFFTLFAIITMACNLHIYSGA